MYAFTPSFAHMNSGDSRGILLGFKRDSSFFFGIRSFSCRFNLRFVGDSAQPVTPFIILKKGKGGRVGRRAIA